MEGKYLRQGKIEGKMDLRSCVKARKQLLLLVDTASSSHKGHIENIYQACCRLLFMHIGFDAAKEGYLEQLTWDYKIFDSNDNRISIMREPSSFNELTSEKLKKFFEVLQEKAENPAHCNESSSGVNTMYTVLVSALQDYQWDMPLLMSPSPLHIKKKSHKQKQYNAIYLITNKFNDLSTSPNTSELEALFPSAVLGQLQNKNIKLCVVYGYKHGVLSEKSKEYIVRLQKLLSHVGGSVVSLSTVVCPLSSSLPLTYPSTTLDKKSLSQYHLLIDKDICCVQILQFCNINGCCVVPLFEEGPIIFKSLGQASTPPLKCFSTVYTCTGLVPSNHLNSLLANGAWKEYYMNPTSENKVEVKISFNSLSSLSTGQASLLNGLCNGPNSLKQEQVMSLTKNKLASSTSDNTQLINSHEDPMTTHLDTNQSSSIVPTLTNDWLSRQTAGSVPDYLHELNLQLSASKSVQVLSINSSNGVCDQIALLHPLTSSICSVSLVQDKYTKEILQSIQHSLPVTTSPSVSIDCQLLCSSEDHDKSPIQSLWSSLSETSSKEPFTQDYLFSWAHLMPKYGVNTAAMKQMKEYGDKLDKHNEQINAPNNTSKLLTLLKKGYSSDKLSSPINASHENEDTPRNTPIQLSPNKSMAVPSYEDILDEYNDRYSTLLTQEGSTAQINEWCKWACHSADKICQSFPGSSDEMWTELNNKLLLDDTKIKQQQLSERNEALTVNKYILQIILHFYFSTHLQENVQSQLVNQIVSLLQRLALLTTPANVGRLLKDHLLNEFSLTSCTLLREVYDELMLPRPQCIDSSSDHSDCELQSDDGTLVQDTENEEDLSSIKSLESFLETIETKETANNPRELRRHASFHRQISISRQPSIKKAHSKKDKRKVRRSLFDRSRSFGGGSRNLSHQNDDNHHSIVVKETPIKKQVENYRKFKLERLRSKSRIEKDDISIVEESPKRTFYSVSSCPTGLENDEPLPRPSNAIVFKTPPSKLISPSFMTHGGDKKLSSIALSSLFNSPFTFDTPSSAHSSNSQCKTNPAPSTPELFSSTNTTPQQQEQDQNTPVNKENPLGSLPKAKHTTTATPKSIFGTPPPCSSTLSTPVRLIEAYSSTTAATSSTLEVFNDNFIDESASRMAFILSTPTKSTSAATDLSSYIRKLKD